VGEDNNNSFKFKIGETVCTKNWPNKDTLRCKVVERRKRMWVGKEVNEYRVELLNGQYPGREILLFEKDLWRDAK